MSIQGASVHPKLSEAAMAELKLLADDQRRLIQAVAEDILHRALLGEAYNLKLTLERAMRAGALGRNR